MPRIPDSHNLPTVIYPIISYIFQFVHSIFQKSRGFYRINLPYTSGKHSYNRKKSSITEEKRRLAQKQARSGAQHEPCIEHSIIQSAPLYVSRIATQSKSYHVKYIASCIVYRTAKLHRSAADGTPKNSVRKHHECCRIRQAPQESKKDAHLRDTRPFL